MSAHLSVAVPLDEFDHRQTDTGTRRANPRLTTHFGVAALFRRWRA